MEEKTRINDKMEKINYSDVPFVLNFIALVLGGILFLYSIIDLFRKIPKKREMYFLIPLLYGIMLLIVFIVYSINIKKIPDKIYAKKQYNEMRWSNGAVSFVLLVTSVVLFIKRYYLVPKKNI